MYQELSQLAALAPKQGLGSCHWQEAGPWTWVEQRAALSHSEVSTLAVLTACWTNSVITCWQMTCTPGKLPCLPQWGRQLLAAQPQTWHTSKLSPADGKSKGALWPRKWPSFKQISMCAQMSRGAMCTCCASCAGDMGGPAMGGAGGRAAAWAAWAAWAAAACCTAACCAACMH